MNDLGEPTLIEQSDDDERGPIGVFPSWPAVYAAVAIATLLTIVLLYVFTIALDFSGS